MRDLPDLAGRLRALHLQPPILVLVNVWDAASARTAAALPGCQAVATGSWPIAAALGRPDGEALSRAEMLAVVARIVDAVDLPVTADLEAGYGAGPREVAETIARAIGVGVVGCNLEDGQRPVGEAAARIAAARARADAEGVPLVVNARLDQPFAGDADLDAAVRRARAYLDAGADCVFPIRARGAEILAGWSSGSALRSTRSALPAAPRCASWPSSEWPGSASARARSAPRSPRSPGPERS